MSGSELKAGARILMRERTLQLFVVSLMFFLMTAALSQFQILLSGAAGLYARYMDRIAGGERHSIRMLLSFFLPVGTAAAALLWFARKALRAVFMLYCLKKSRFDDVYGNNVPSGTMIYMKMIQIVAITTALTALWSALFIFPGIAAHYRYRQAYYILFDDPQKSALQCISESKLLMAGNKLDLFLVDMSFMGWHILSAILSAVSLFILPFALPVLRVWTEPYIGLSRALYFDHLMEKATI